MTIRDTRKPWEKLRWWALGALILAAILVALGFDLSGECIEHSRWEFC